MSLGSNINSIGTTELVLAEQSQKQCRVPIHLNIALYDRKRMAHGCRLLAHATLSNEMNAFGWKVSQGWASDSPIKKALSDQEVK